MIRIDGVGYERLCGRCGASGITLQWGDAEGKTNVVLCGYCGEKRVGVSPPRESADDIVRRYEADYRFLTAPEREAAEHQASTIRAIAHLAAICGLVGLLIWVLAIR